MTVPLTIPAREYIHLPSIGDISKSKDAIGEIDNALKQSLDDNKIIGYQIFLITSANDIDRHYIETDYRSVTNDTFPFTYVFIQADEEQEYIAQMAKALALQEM